MKRSISFAGLASFIIVAQSALAQQSCEMLKNTHLSLVEITSSALMPAGPFGKWNASLRHTARHLPAFCNIKAVARPTSDSEIEIEVWLPAAGWNGKYVQVGYCINR